MPELKEVEKKLGTVGDIQTVVSTMKTLAAVSVNRYKKSVESVKEYRKSIEIGLQVTARELADKGKTRFSENVLEMVTNKNGDSKKIYLLVGSEQGMCGKFNNEIINGYETEMGSISGDTDKYSIFLIGERLIRIGEKKINEPIEKLINLPSSFNMVGSFVRSLEMEIFKTVEESTIEFIKIIYNKPDGKSSGFTTKVKKIFPIESKKLNSIKNRKWTGSSLPVVLGKTVKSLRILLRKYFSAQLFSTVIQSAAAENGARLASMEGAERNIKEKKSELNKKYNTLRQQSITSELLDIIGGFEVLV